MTSSVMGLKLGIFGFLLTTENKCRTSALTISALWGILNMQNFESQLSQDKNGADSRIVLIYLWLVQTHFFIFFLSPFKGSGSCVEMMNDAEHPGDWNDVDCENKNAYLCQMPLGKY